jgi:3-isopropylmalate dehydrogenase
MSSIPWAAINAAGMMLDFLGEEAAAAAVDAAVIQVINTKVQSLAAGRMGYGTREVGDLIAAAV